MFTLEQRSHGEAENACIIFVIFGNRGGHFKTHGHGSKPLRNLNLYSCTDRRSGAPVSMIAASVKNSHENVSLPRGTATSALPLTSQSLPIGSSFGARGLMPRYSKPRQVLVPPA